MRNATLRAAIYARVSSEQQAKNATVASQLDALRGRLEQDGLALDPTRATAAACSSARRWSGCGTRPPPGPWTASTSWPPAGSPAGMPRACYELQQNPGAAL